MYPGKDHSAQAYVSTEEVTKKARARLPRAHEDESGARRPQGTAPAGTLPADRGLSYASHAGGQVERQQQRLRKRAEFAAVYASGRSWANRLLVLKARPNGLSYSRLGYAIGARVGNAVRRNRVRRQLRETVRRLCVRPGWDAVVTARAEAAEAEPRSLRAALEELFRRAKLLEDATGS